MVFEVTVRARLSPNTTPEAAKDELAEKANE